MNGMEKNIQNFLSSKKPNQNGNRLNLEINPTVSENLPPIENYFVDKYGNYWNGEYHIHKGGQFCKGNHDDNMTMLSENFIRPEWLVQQYQSNRETRNEKINWNNQPFNWSYDTYYDESGGTSPSCASAADQGNVRYVILDSEKLPGDECFDFHSAGNPYGCDNFYDDSGALVHEYQNCYYDCDFHCKADIYFFNIGPYEPWYPYAGNQNETCHTCGGGTASYPEFQNVHNSMINASIYNGPFNDVNMWCDEFDYDAGFCDQDSTIDSNECVPPRYGQIDVWIQEICVFEDKPNNNAGSQEWYDTMLYWFPHYDVNYNPGYGNLGCIDPYALNFDTEATVNDGSCEFQDGWGTDSQYRGLFYLTEIKSSPHGSNTKYEFLEFTNASNDTIDISGWWFHCDSTNDSYGFCSDGGILWRFPSNEQSENTCGWDPWGNTTGTTGCYPLGSRNHSHDFYETTHIVPPGGKVILERHGGDGPNGVDDEGDPYSKYSGSFKFRGSLNAENSITLFDNTGALVNNLRYEAGSGGWPSGAYNSGFSIEYKLPNTSDETMIYLNEDPGGWILTGLVPCNTFTNSNTCGEYQAAGCYFDFDNSICRGQTPENIPDVPGYPLMVGLDVTEGGGAGLTRGNHGSADDGYSPGGCTSPIANNYNSNARWDDETCEYPDWGNEQDNTNPIVINEIHWNPSGDAQGDDSDFEFIEIYNRSGQTIQMAGVQFTTQENITDDGNNPRNQEYPRFQFPIGVTIESNNYIVIANNISTYNTDDFSWLIEDYNLFEWQAFYSNGEIFSLDQDGMTLRLRDIFNNLIDEVTYLNEWGGDASGPSIELVDPYQDNKFLFDDDGNRIWMTSQIIGGTPGLNNTPNIIGCVDELDTWYEPSATIAGNGACSGISIYNDTGGFEGGIIITEINHQNPLDNPENLAYEFIEIYNSYITPINLLDFTIHAVGWTGNENSMPDVTIIPGELLVLCRDSNLYDGCIQWPEGGQLATAGELITIRDPNYNVVDEIPLTDIISNIGQTYDFTYEMIYEDEPNGIDNSIWSNWRKSDFVGGSPGEHSVDGNYGCTDELDISYDEEANLHDSEDCSNISIYEGGIIITEIKDRYEGQEFIELYNNRDYDINLQGFRIYAVGWSSEAPMPNINIPAGEYLVIAEPLAVIELDTLYEHLNQGINLLGWPTDGFLVNEGELIRITDPGNNEVDSVCTGGCCGNEPEDGCDNGLCGNSCDIPPNGLIENLGQHGSYSWELTTFEYGGNSVPSNWQIGSVVNGTPGLPESQPGLYGCTDPIAVNYNPSATLDDGLCTYIWGDVNQDNILNILDLLILLNHVLDLVLLPDTLESAADFNQDGVINILDIVSMVNAIIGSDIISTEATIRNITGNELEENLNISQIILVIEFLMKNTDTKNIKKIDNTTIKNLKKLTSELKFVFTLDDYSLYVIDNLENFLNNISMDESRQDGLLITEILYDVSEGNYYDYQFVEIYNNSNMSVDITGYKFRTRTIDGSLYTRYQFGCELGCRLCDEPQTTVLQSYQFMVIADQDSTYNGVNNLTTGVNLLEWQQNGICGATSNYHLNRTSGLEVILSQSDDSVVTQVDYYPDGSNGMPNSETLLSTNSSLELISVDGINNDPTNWHASLVSNGTPGIQNTQDPIYGCTDISSCTYNPGATIDDGSCQYIDCNGECGGEAISGACGCNDDISCLGCTDPIALNYDEEAVIDDNSCEYFDYIGSIVINEIHYNPSTVEQGEDELFEFVELYNRTNEIIPMEGIKFTTQLGLPDEGYGEYSRFIFPAINFNPNTYIVLANNQAQYSGINGLTIGENLFEWQETLNDGETIVNLSNSTMTLRLRDPNWDGNLESDEIDYVPYQDGWGADASGKSLELKQEFIDFNNWYFSNWQESLEVGGTPGLPNSIQVLGCTDPIANNYNSEANIENGSCIYPDYTDSIVISEIHYNPSLNFQGDDDNYEFIEIYNRSNETINMNGFKFSMEGSSSDTQEYNRLIFPNVEFPINTYIVIAINSTPPIDNQLNNPYENLEEGVNLFEWVGDQAWSLNNFDSMTLRIKDPSGSVVTSVTYSGQVPWPQNITTTGSSIELIDLYGSNNDGNNWQASYITNGTPGEINSTSADETIIGCTDPTSCSYEPLANVNNPDACIFIDDYQNTLDCGEVTVGIPSGIFGCDCAGQCGGSTWLDHCSVCQGNGTSCPFEWGGGIEIEPINTYGVSVNNFKFKPIGNEPEHGTWTSPYNDDSGTQCDIIKYVFVLDRKINDEQTSPEAPFTVSPKSICNTADCTCSQCSLSAEGGFLDIGGYIKLIEKAGIYIAAYTVEDSCGNIGAYQLQFEVLDSLLINQTINSSYIPSQGINFNTENGITLSETWFKNNNLLSKPPLGMFYYDEEQPPFLLWESVVGDAYEDFDINLSNNLSTNYEDRITPDLDVRTYRSKTGHESVPYKYYDRTIQETEYYENTGPTELEFYFYSRQSFTNPNDFFIDRDIIDLNDYPADYHLFVGFIDWDDDSDLEFVDEPRELFNNTIIKHTYNNPGIYEIKGYMLLATDGVDENSGYIDYKRFTFRLYLGKDESYEQPYVNINAGEAIISGISPYSIYYKTISRQLGYYPELEGLINLYFDQYYDKLDTEYALAQIDASRIGENVAHFAVPVYDQSRCNDPVDTCSEITCPNGTCVDYLYNCTNVCESGWYQDENIALNNYNLIWSGNDFNNYGIFGNYLGEVDIAQSRVYLDGNKSMWEMLGFSGNNAEASVEVLEAVREQAVLITAPHGQTAFRPTINSTHGYDTYTTSFAKILHQLTDIPVIYAKYKTDDPNYYHTIPNGTLTPAYEDLVGEVMPYKRTIQKYLEEHPNIKFVIDLHGASWTRPFALDLGFTGPKNTAVADAYIQPSDDGGTYPLYDIFSNMELYAPSLKTQFGKQEFIPGILEIMENNNVGYGDSDGYGVTLQHTYTGGGTQNTTTAWVTRDANSEFVFNSDKYVDGVQFEWSRDYRRFEPITTIDENCTNQLGDLVDEAYNSDGTLIEITDEYSCTTTGFCYSNNIINYDLSDLGNDACDNHESGNYQWINNLYTEINTEPSVTDTRSTQAMVDVINFINKKYNYDTIEPTETEVLTWVNQVDSDWQENFLSTGEVTLDDNAVPLENHPGNPNDSRYWENFIPEYYNLDNRNGVLMDSMGNYIISETDPQDWLFYEQCDDVEWEWDLQVEDGDRQRLRNEVKCTNAYPYYPVLPKYNWKGQFDIDLGLSNENIPFGSPYRFWDNYDNKAPVSNIYDNSTKLLIDLDTTEIDEGKLMDISGNDNRGNIIADYRIDFDDENRKPTANKQINKIKTGSPDDGAY